VRTKIIVKLRTNQIVCLFSQEKKLENIEKCKKRKIEKKWWKVEKFKIREILEN